MMLWPQACPTSGNASYSAQKTRCSAPEPDVARKAVGRSAASRSTENPADSAAAATAAAEANSW